MSNSTLFLIAVAVIMLSAVPVAMIMKDVLPGFIQRNSGFDQIENRIYILHSEAQDLQDRVKTLTAQRNAQSSEKSRLESDIRRMEKAIGDLADQPPLFVHEVGDPQAGHRKFVATVTQEKASAAARASGERTQVNPIWRHSNVAEVWAASFDEAKQLVEVAFPFKMGFEKSFQIQKGTTAGGAGTAGPAAPRPPATAGAGKAAVS